MYFLLPPLPLILSPTHLVSCLNIGCTGDGGERVENHLYELVCVVIVQSEDIWARLLFKNGTFYIE